MSNYLLGVDVLIGQYADEPLDEAAVVEQAVAETVAEEAAAKEAVEGQSALQPYDAEPSQFARLLKSELPGVRDDEWTLFALAMKTADVASVSDSGALGMFEMRPRRLGDLGLMKNIKPGNARATGSMKWSGEWVKPLSEKKFLTSAEEQYKAFSSSMRNYFEKLLSGEIKEEGDLSSAGMLAVLHRCGPNGLKTWATGERFEETIDLVNKTDGIF